MRNYQHFPQLWKLYPMIGVDTKARKLPDEGIAEQTIELIGRMYVVYVTPKPTAGVRWGHRVKVICRCGKHIPFGRMCQHVGPCDRDIGGN